MSCIHHRTIVASALFFGCFNSICLAQQGGPVVTIPVQIISCLVFMQGEVNGSGPLNVVLDSGSGVSIVNPRVAEALHLASTHSSQAAGIGKGLDQTLHFVDDCELKWGSPERKLNLLHQQSAILPIDYIAEQLGKRVDAIFGSNLFLHYTITVDYEQQRVTFAVPGFEGTPSGSPIPLQITNNVPFVQATIEGEDGKRITALFLVDSGTAGRAVVLSRAFLKAHPGLVAESHFVENPAATAVGGVIHSKLVLVPRLSLGPFAFSQVVATVPEANSGVLSTASIAGFIGSGILKRFTVTWDYEHKVMFLSPNSAIGEPFETDSSGLHLASAWPEYRSVTIDSVLSSSPADRAGLMPNDEILAVNEVENLPLWRVSELLRKSESSVLLTILRKAQILKIRVLLQSPFQKTE